MKITMPPGWCPWAVQNWCLSLSLSTLFYRLNPETITYLLFQITQVADKIGVGVHFNPFVTWNGKVHILVDNLDIGDVNSVNLRAAVSAALLLLPSKFTEEDLYSKICSLSYMGDLRMLFAEDKNKFGVSAAHACNHLQVKRIVEGQFGLFQSMYKPFLKEYEAKELLTFSLPISHQATISQHHLEILIQSLSKPGVQFINDSFPSSFTPSPCQKKNGDEARRDASAEGFCFNNVDIRFAGRVLHEVVIGSREEAARSMQRIIRRTVMVSSARQAVSGFLAAGGINATRYLANKVRKAWKSWT
ncbi:hypothetical protein POTOM_000585 [Populus tomentosa]|uniref:Phosphatidate cytidylyltransferase, mitochondrial n=1 Tax=Populus tomentosa TaxID=118781 RepID=A0A8X8IXH0_POPTO|nr:hypothetical protein POTOM_000585 [Populus tomentosa]